MKNPHSGTAIVGVINAQTPINVQNPGEECYEVGLNKKRFKNGKVKNTKRLSRNLAYTGIWRLNTSLKVIKVSVLPNPIVKNLSWIKCNKWSLFFA